MTPEELEVAVGLLAARTAALEDRASGSEDGQDALTDRIALVENSTPTLEETWLTWTASSWNGATTFGAGPRMTMMSAPVKCRILSVDLVLEYSTITGAAAVVSSNTNYWRLVLERGKPDGSFPDFGAKNTAISGAEAGGAIYTRKTWSFDSSNWNSDRDLSKGDTLCLLWQAVGDPTDIRLPMTATIRYAAL